MADFSSTTTEMCKYKCKNCMNGCLELVFQCCACKEFHLCLQCFVYGCEIGPHRREHEMFGINLGAFTLFEPKKLPVEPKKNYGLDYDDDDDDSSNDSVSADVKMKQAECSTSKMSDIDHDHKNLQEFLTNQLGKEFCENCPIATNYPREFYEEREWRAIEEKILLEGLTRFGYGNWEMVSNFINDNLNIKISCTEIENHYYNHYIDGILGRLSWTWVFTDAIQRFLCRFPFTFEDEPPEKENSTHIPAEMDAAELESIRYWPKRDDFETEFDNDAETVISNLKYEASDESEQKDDLEQLMKQIQHTIYKKRLIDRWRKKAIVNSNEFIRLFFETNRNELKRDTGTNKNVKDFSEKYPIFMSLARYLTKPDLFALFNDMAMEQVLKIILRILIHLSCLSESNLASVDISTKLNLIRSLNETIDKNIIKKNDCPSDGGSKCRSTRSDNVEGISDQSEADIMKLLCADEDPNIKDYLNQLLTQEPFPSISNMLAEFIQKQGTTDFDSFLEKSIKLLEEEKSRNSFKELFNQLSQSETGKVVDNDDSNDEGGGAASTNSSSSSGPSSLESVVSNGSNVSNDNQPTLLVSASERKLYSEFNIDSKLFSKLKDDLIKQHKRYPNASGHRLNTDTILLTSGLDQEQRNLLKQIHKYLVATETITDPGSERATGD